jgi:hypothetical protein
MHFRDSHRGRHQVRFLAAVVFAAAFKVASVSGQPTVPHSPDQKQPIDAVAQQSDDTDVMEQLRKSVRQLTVALERLAKRVANLEAELLFDATRVRLLGEEQRAESLQVRLRETFERQIVLQARLEQVDSQMRPENIERMFAGIGSVRPEEAREAVRRRLNAEKQGIVAQLELLRQERNRYQAALATADVAIQRLRQRLSEVGRP